jgi:hypothetical protein
MVPSKHLVWHLISKKNKALEHEGLRISPRQIIVDKASLEYKFIKKYYQDESAAN